MASWPVTVFLESRSTCWYSTVSWELVFSLPFFILPTSLAMPLTQADLSPQTLKTYLCLHTLQKKQCLFPAKSNESPLSFQSLLDYIFRLEGRGNDGRVIKCRGKDGRERGWRAVPSEWCGGGEDRSMRRILWMIWIPAVRPRLPEPMLAQ